MVRHQGVADAAPDIRWIGFFVSEETRSGPQAISLGPRRVVHRHGQAPRSIERRRTRREDVAAIVGLTGSVAELGFAAMAFGVVSHVLNVVLAVIPL